MRLSTSRLTQATNPFSLLTPILASEYASKYDREEIRVRITFTLAAALMLAAALAPDQSHAANLTTLYSFCAQTNCTDSAFPVSGLIADANGNLFGTTIGGRMIGSGTVFEIAKTASGYASTPTTLVRFDGTDGSSPGGLIADANSNLFGTAEGGSYGYGTVFEIAKTASGYASTPTTLVNFDGTDGYSPAGLIADANGNLFGTTDLGGASYGNPNADSGYGYGTVFEVVRAASGYASYPTTLYSFCTVEPFNCTDGASPLAGLLADANGNLFGTTYGGGAYAYGTVFEIAKTANGYAGTPTTLVSFCSLANCIDGAFPVGGLIADANGDLFGTTDGGTVFEIVNNGTRSAPNYASTPTTLVSFNGADGAGPQASLIADANGNLFGTTVAGGSYGDGTVFEIAKTANGYASTPTTLVSFNGTNGQYPRAGLIADANGNLFGTTYFGGVSANCPADITIGCGTVFEITGSGFIPPGVLAGTPEQANCIGKSISGFSNKYGTLLNAAAALGYSVQDLQNEVMIYCGA
jgi:uncharacterized repeat protein (TIGR03803 family)